MNVKDGNSPGTRVYFVAKPLIYQGTVEFYVEFLVWVRQLQRGTMTSNFIVSSKFLFHLIRIDLNFSNYTFFDKKKLEKCSKFDVFISFVHFFALHF